MKETGAHLPQYLKSEFVELMKEIIHEIKSVIDLRLPGTMSPNPMVSMVMKVK